MKYKVICSISMMILIKGSNFFTFAKVFISVRTKTYSHRVKNCKCHRTMYIVHLVTFRRQHFFSVWFGSDFNPDRDLDELPRRILTSPNLNGFEILMLITK
jgi:hypothetical protein